MNTILKMTFVWSLVLVTASILGAQHADAQLRQGRGRLSPQQRLLQSVRNRAPVVRQNQPRLRFPDVVAGSTRSKRLRILAPNRNQPGGSLRPRSSDSWGNRNRNSIVPGMTYYYGPDGRQNSRRFGGEFRGAGKPGQRLRIVVEKFQQIAPVIAPAINALGGAAASGTSNATNSDRQRMLNALQRAKEIRAMSKD